jgi:hypothetical protein
LAVAGTVAGTAAAVVAYQSAASVGSAGTEPASVKTDNPAASTTTWLPCEHGWKVVGETCVRVKKKVVVVHDLPAPAAVPARSAGVRSAASGGGTSGEDAQGDDVNDDNDANEAEQDDDDSSENEAQDDSSDDSQDAGDDSGSEDVGGDD